MAEHNEFGKVAEAFVAAKYEKEGYLILERNWRFHPYELDIVAKKGTELVVVEVKARASEDWAAPEDAVTKSKKRFLVKAANEYILLNDIDLECRFDIAVVLKKDNGLTVNVIADAFLAHEC